MVETALRVSGSGGVWTGRFALRAQQKEISMAVANCDIKRICLRYLSNLHVYVTYEQIRRRRAWQRSAAGGVCQQMDEFDINLTLFIEVALYVYRRMATFCAAVHRRHLQQL